MNKFKQHGLGTLMVVSGIAVIIAAFSAVVAKSGFSEVKRTQAIVISAREGGVAKAGLQCAAALIQNDNLNPNDENFIDSLDSCKETVGVSYQINDSEPWVLTSTFKNASFKLLMAASGGGGAATFKTTGDVTFEGAFSWVPARLEFEKTVHPFDYYKCSSIIAGGDVTIGGGFQSGLQRAASSLDKCISGYTTTVVTEMTNNFGADIQHGVDINKLNFFQETFNKDASKWQKVRESFDEKFSSLGDKCGQTLNDLMTSGEYKDKSEIRIWIDGDCQLDGLKKEGHPPNLNALIVIKDGALGSHGAIGGVNASFYLFDHRENSDDKGFNYGSSWLDKNGNCKEGPLEQVCTAKIDTISNEDWKRMPFLFVGSFDTNGFFIVDVEGSYSHIFAGFAPKYMMHLQGTTQMAACRRL